jgi:hypothetical protein
MILGSITYKGVLILDISPYWAIGTPEHSLRFDSLEEAKQFINNYLLDTKGVTKCN